MNTEIVAVGTELLLGDIVNTNAQFLAQELAAMVRAIRNIEAARGSAEKKPSPSEQKNIAIARKSIVARRPIRQGELLTEENLAVKRPGNGISPMCYPKILGTRAIRDFQEDERIEGMIL